MELFDKGAASTLLTLAFHFGGLDVRAVAQGFGRADDEVLAADQPPADFNFISSDGFDDRNRALNGLAIFDDEHSAIANRRCRNANAGTLGCAAALRL